jgi:hypothetical protein
MINSVITIFFDEVFLLFISIVKKPFQLYFQGFSTRFNQNSVVSFLLRIRQIKRPDGLANLNGYNDEKDDFEMDNSLTTRRFDDLFMRQTKGGQGSKGEGHGK